MFQLVYVAQHASNAGAAFNVYVHRVSVNL